MSRNSLVIFALAVLMLFCGAANASSCGFIVPCRSVKVVVLHCELDSKSFSRNQANIERLENLVRELREKGLNSPEYEENLERLRSRPYSYTVVADVKAVMPTYCALEGFEVSGGRHLFQWIDAARRSVADSVGMRQLDYQGATDNECPKLREAEKFRIRMNLEWCASGRAVRPWEPSSTWFAEILSID